MATGPTGPIGYISAGRYQQTGGTLNVIGPTGSIMSTVSAVEINVSGTLSANVVNANTLTYQNLDLSGNLYVNGTIGTRSGFSVDVSGNVSTRGTLGTSSGFSVDVSGNVSTHGTFGTSSGFSVDVSGNVIVPNNLKVKNLDLSGNLYVNGTFGTRSGFSVDVSGNVSTQGTVGTSSGFSIDHSGNIVIAGSTVMDGFVTTQSGVNIMQDLSVDQNVTIAENISILGQEYLGGNIYVNNGITIGDTSGGSGCTLNTTIDASFNKFLNAGYKNFNLVLDSSGIPVFDTSDNNIILNVNGGTVSEYVTVSGNQPTKPFSFKNTDSSGQTFLGIETKNNSTVVSDPTVTADNKIQVIINNVKYYLLLKAV